MTKPLSDRPEQMRDVAPEDPWWVCGRMQRVQAHTAMEAARVFADRLARRAHGPDTGSVGAIVEDGSDGNWHRFTIYIGRRLRDGTISGHNEWLDVERL